MIHDIVHVQGDDWEGCYVDGKLFSEGHHINWLYVLRQLGHDTSQIEANYEWLNEIGNLPENLSDVQTYGE